LHQAALMVPEEAPMSFVRDALVHMGNWDWTHAWHDVVSLLTNS
jgi:hypothetical protein